MWPCGTAVAGLIGFFLVAMGPATTPRAQPRAIADARIRASVDLNATQTPFVYQFVVENGGASAMSLGRLIVDLDSRETTLAAPTGWTATLDAAGNARWVTAQQTASILPNRSLSGFSITSENPPAVRPFTLAPYLAPEQTTIAPAGDDPGEEERFAHDFDLYIASRAIAGMTIGPQPIPSRTLDGVLTHLEAQIARGRAARWIADDAAARDLTAKIGNARAAAKSGTPDRARSLLQNLQSEIAARKGKGLTPEMAALIDVSIRYTLRQTTTR